MRHLAEINVARLKHPAADPRVAAFVDAVDRVNAVADRAPGFVWRLDGDGGGRSGTWLDDDPQVIATLSVWDGVRSLETFVWNTVHKQFFRRRAAWFDALEKMHFAMWWVASGHTPGLVEAVARLDHLDAHGNTDHAFGWDHLPEATLWRAGRGAALSTE